MFCEEAASCYCGTYRKGKKWPTVKDWQTADSPSLSLGIQMTRTNNSHFFLYVFPVIEVATTFYKIDFKITDYTSKNFKCVGKDSKSFRSNHNYNLYAKKKKKSDLNFPYILP